MAPMSPDYDQNSIVPPSHIATNSNYYLFKDGIKPAWEDPANTDGGKWAIQLPRDKNRDTIDKYWLYTVGLVEEGKGGLELQETACRACCGGLTRAARYPESD